MEGCIMVDNVKKPLVSVVINCYNGAEYLKQAVESIIFQTYSNWELIFWDNQSTDNSKSIITSYKDNRIKYFYSECHTILGEARKLAIAKCNGDFITFLDCDDLWVRNKIEIQIESMLPSNAVLCYAGVSILDSAENEIIDLLPKHRSGFIFEDLLIDFDINMTTPMIRKSILVNKNLNFDANIYASEEVNLFLRIAYYGEIVCLPFILASARVSGNSLTNNSISHWHDDLKYTINQLIEICPRIKSDYPIGYRHITARYYYYKSRYYLSENESFKSIYFALRSSLLVRVYGIYLLVLFLPFRKAIFILYENKNYRFKLFKLKDFILKRFLKLYLTF